MEVGNEEADIPTTLQQLCRLCLGDESLEDIFSQDDLHEWISDFLSIMVCVDDKISKSICFCCRTRLTEFRNFQQQCLEVQDVLQGEMTAILNEKALQLIVADPESDVPQVENLPVEWEMVPVTSHQVLPPESKEKSDLPEKPVEWEDVIPEAQESSSNVVSDVSKSDVSTVETASPHKEEVPKSKKLPASDKPSQKAATPTTHQAVTYKCEVCPKEYQTKRQLSNHRSTHIKRYACAICSKAFFRPFRLKNHMKTHNKPGSVQPTAESVAPIAVSVAPITESVGSIAESVALIVKSVAPITESVAPIEGIEEPSANNQTDKVSEHIEETSTQSTAEEIESTTVASHDIRAIKVEELMIEDLEIDEHEPISETAHVSTEATTTSTEVAESAKADKSKEKQPKGSPAKTAKSSGLECADCGKQFVSRKQYRGHRWFVHSPKTHICSVCGKGYVSAGRLAVHQKCHRGQEPRPHIVIPPSSETIQIADGDQTSIIHINRDESVQCEVCGKKYSDKKRLNVHRRIIHGSTKHVCPICSRSFNIRECMIKHMLIHRETRKSIYQPNEEIFDDPLHGPRVHTCSICKESFVQLRGLEAHKATHGRTKDHLKQKLDRIRCKSKQVTITQGDKSYEMFECPQCHKYVSTRRQLFDHRKRVHKPRKYACPICGKPFVTRQDMYMHIKSHDNTSRRKRDNLRNQDGLFICEICDRVLGSKCTLVSHLRLVHGNRRYVCSYDHCKKKFMTNYDMKKHMLVHNPDNKSMFQCHLCICRFITKSKLVNHLQWHERKEKLREKLSMDKPQREVHEVQVNANDSVVVTVFDVDASEIDQMPSSEDKVEDFLQKKCRWIDDSGGKPTVVEVRYGTVQDSEGRIKKGCEAIPTQACTVCDQQIQVSLMEGHLNRHAGIRPYKCEKGCKDAYFYCQLLLRTHHTRAHGNLPSQCNICHKVYPSRLRMRSHQREVHEKIHVCMNCPQIFDSSASLKKHIETANHTKRYPCPKCNSSFDRQYQLNKHLKKHEDAAEGDKPMEVEDSIEVEEVKIESRVDEDEEMPSKA